MSPPDLSPLTFQPRVTVTRGAACTFNAFGARAVMLRWTITARCEHPTTRVELDPDGFARGVRGALNGCLWVGDATFLLSHVEARRAEGGGVVVEVCVVRLFAAREALPLEPWDALGCATVEGKGGALLCSASNQVFEQWERHPPHAALLRRAAHEGVEVSP